MFKLFTASTGSSQPQQQEPNVNNSIISTQAALHATRTGTKPQSHKIINNKYPFNGSWHATEYVEGFDAQQLLDDTGNFSDGMAFEADLFVSESVGDWTTYKIRDSSTLQRHLKTMQYQSSGVTNAQTCVLFVYLSPGVRYGNSKLSIDGSSMEHLLSSIDVSPAAVPTLFGRPDYWSPGHYAGSEATEFWCQHPRWDIHNREQPISVYMKNGYQSTTYLITGDRNDYVINHLQDCLRCGTDEGSKCLSPNSFLDVFAIHYLLARLSFEFSKSFVSSLRRTLYDQLDKIDRHTQSISTAGEREELKKRTTDLSLLSQNVDSFLAGFQMALGIANKLKNAHGEYVTVLEGEKEAIGRNTGDQRLIYSIQWLESSLESQLRWLHSYKARKDTSMTLVYNLVTQQDSSILIQDSSSMKGIAMLTMVFLPGTFTSTLLSCGIVTVTNFHHMDVTGLWWFWLAFTIPLTFVVVGVFLLWSRKKQTGLDWKEVFRFGRKSAYIDAEKVLENKHA